MSNSGKRAVRAVAGAVGAVGLFLCAVVGASSYTYDAQGRLKTITDANQETAEYVYDAVGNLLEIKRYSATDLAITSFAPMSGPAGTVVTVNGSGFASQTAGNQVTFNGAAASVNAATPTSLSVTVPVGASSGHIGVTANAHTAVSADNFAVTADDGKPTITDFNPKCAGADQVVSVTGTNFDARVGATRAEVNGHLGRTTVTAPTALTFATPRYDIGGKVRIVTASGTAESTVPLTVATTSWPCSGFAAGYWLNVDAAPTSVALPPSNQYVTLYFTGTQGQLLSLQASGLNPSSGFANFNLTFPDGAPAGGTGTFSSSSLSYHLAVLPQTGTYMLRMYQSSASTTTINLRLQSTPVLSPDGSAMSLVSDPGQSVRVALAGGTTAPLGAAVSPFSLTPSYASASLTLYAPDGTTVTPFTGSVGQCGSNGPGCHLNFAGLPSEGLYTLIWRPSGVTAPSSGTLYLSNDFQATLSPGLSLPINLNRYGRNARLQFQAAAGSGVSLSIADLAFSQGSTSLGFHVFDPLGTELSTVSFITSGKMITIPFLPLTGTYTLFLDPDFGGHASFEATLDPGVVLQVDGAAQTLSSSKAGRGFRLLIDGMAKQKIGIGLLDLSTTVANPTNGTNPVNSTIVKLYSSSGTYITSETCYHKVVSTYPGCELDLGPLPVAGRYAITIEPPAAATTVSMRVQASNDVIAPLTDTLQPVAIIREGGNARLTWQGVPGAGQTLSIAEFATDPTNQTAYVSVLRPDGALLTRAPLLTGGVGSMGQTATIRIGDFPYEGIYTLFFDPTNAATSTFKAKITPGVDVFENGSQIPTHKTVIPGPWARHSFTGEIGGHMSVGVKFQGAPPNPAPYPMVITVLDDEPLALLVRGSGVATNSCYASAGGCEFDLPDLPKTGTYQALVELPTDDPALSAVDITAAGDVVINGTSGTFNLAAWGQNGRLVFQGTAGHTPTIALSRQSPAGGALSIPVVLYSPQGVSVWSSVLGGTETSRTWTLSALPASGQYTLYLDPDGGNPSAITATITSP